MTLVQNFALGKVTYDWYCVFNPTFLVAQLAGRLIIFSSSFSFFLILSLFHREECLAKFREQLSMDAKQQVELSLSSNGKKKSATVSNSHESVDETTMKGGDEELRVARVHSGNYTGVVVVENDPNGVRVVLANNESQVSLPEGV